MRRFFLPALSVGELQLPADQAHHIRDVLRLTEGTQVEVFDGAGQRAGGELVFVSAKGVVVRIRAVQPCGEGGSVMHLTVAAAVPKAARADWMVEKLSELGVDVFIPLATARSVALPRGNGKLDRWNRLAEESAKQSGRAGVMQIAALTDLEELIRSTVEGSDTWYLSTDRGAVPLSGSLVAMPLRLTLLIGPEGGWTAEEIAAFEIRNIAPKRLTASILRIETAAVAAAAIIESALTPPAGNATIEV